ncbi:hypothetical protein MRB53_042256 [Persea americana]|nr:hypothetical protein MRB53_042256 [Persea americana]
MLKLAGEHGVLIYRNYAWRDASIIFGHLAGIIKDDDEVTRCRLNQGLIYARLGDYDAARDIFSNMPRRSRNSVLACCILAEIGICAGDADEALAWYYLCRDHLAECDDRAEFDRFDFKLTPAMVEENISTLRDARRKTTEEIRFLNLHRLPGDCIFSSNLSVQDLYIAIDSTIPVDINPAPTKEQETPSRVSQARNKVLQWLHSSGIRRDSTSTKLIEPLLEPFVAANQEIMPPRMVPRDARVTYTSNRHLADFIRHTGPGDSENTCLMDQSYVEKLLDSDSRPTSSIAVLPERRLFRSKTEPVLESVPEHVVGSSARSRGIEEGPFATPRARPQSPFVVKDDVAASVDVAPSIDIVWPNRHRRNRQR